MSVRDVVAECVPGKWVPLLVMRHEGKVILPLFTETSVARRFVERNVGRKWISGTVNVTLEDAKWIDDKGWAPAVYEFPRRLKEAVEFDVEILEYEDDREVVVV